MATSTSAKNVDTSATKSLQTELGNIKTKKTLQPVILGGSWAPFGEGLGRSGASLGHSWAALGGFGGVRKRAFLHHRSKMVSQRPSKWILGRFGQGLGRVWEGWARVLEGFGSSFLRPPRCLANSLGVTMRGGLRPLSVLEGSFPQGLAPWGMELCSSRAGLAYPADPDWRRRFGGSWGVFFRSWPLLGHFLDPSWASIGFA